MAPKASFDPIAIIGIGAIFPGSSNAGDFWRNIVNGKDLITDIPPSHWLIEDYYDPDPKTPDMTYCKRGGFLPPMAFNPVEYGIPPANLSQTDSTQLFSLMATKQLLEDAFGRDFDKTADLSRANVILGVTSAQELGCYASARLQHPIWRKALREMGIPQDIEEQICQRISDSYVPWTESMFPGLLGNVVSGRIANRFNFGGTNCVTDAACASSLAALSMAINELHLGRADLAVTGGADTINDIFMYVCFSKTPALSFSGNCRPFAKSADGTLLGEGIGLIALKRLADAERDGNTIYAVIRGIGSSSDGRAKSVYAPLSNGQAVAIGRSYAAAGFDPKTIELIEAHGTGTVAGDAAEAGGLKLAFNASQTTAKPWCAIGSIKSQIGHTKAAAGSASLIKTVLALRHKILPPLIKVDEPNPDLGIEGSPFYLNTQTRPWIRAADHPRRAGVSAFGFGGTNFHIALEEYQGQGRLAAKIRTLPTELVLLSAESVPSMISLIEKTIQQAGQKDALTWLAKQSQLNFSSQLPARVAVIASDATALIAKLKQVNDQLIKNPHSGYNQRDIYYNYGAQPGKIAFLFPGQGSQYLNMGADLLMGFDAAQAMWSEVDGIEIDANTRLQEVVFPPPVFGDERKRLQQKKLAQTQWAQPALAATSLTQLALLEAVGVTADCYAGHSFGELVALYAGGVFDRQTLIQLARKRGELMAQAADIPGAMTAVMHVDVQALLAKIAAWQLDVAPANFNSPEQTVFSGPETAIAALETNLGKEKISFKRLPVSTAFHSRVIAASQQPFMDFLNTLVFQKPKKPVYANTTAAVYPEDSALIKQYLAVQLLNPVHFVAQIETMYASGVRTFIEVGPQNILTNFVKKILSGKDFYIISLDNKQNGITSLWNALGQLAVSGIKLNLSALWQEYAEPIKPQPFEEKSFKITISGTSYGKPYPPAGGAKDLPLANPVGHIPDWAQGSINSATSNNERIQPMLLNQFNVSDLSKENQPSSHEATLEKILSLYQKLQEDVTKAHVEYQTLSEKSHLAYLEEARTALDDIRMLAMAGNDIAHEATHGEMNSHAVATKQILNFSSAQIVNGATNGHENQLEAFVQPKNSEVTHPIRIDPPVMAPAPAAVQHMAPPPVMLAAAVAPAASAAVRPLTEAPIVPNQISTDVDPTIQTTMLAIVAEKTGYPEDTLSMDMDLEADLGIDSIKRVEILSAIQEQIPNLPELNPADLTGLHTFKEIAIFVKKQQGV